jgi:hypothetical protein
LRDRPPPRVEIKPGPGEQAHAPLIAHPKPSRHEVKQGFS